MKDAGGSSSPLSAADAGDAGDAPDTGTPITETGVMVDYETLYPIKGLTVTDNGVSAVTDSTGTFTLQVPAGTALLSPSVTGPNYSHLIFPFSTPGASTVDFGTVVMGDVMTYALEQRLLENDQTMALVQVVVKLAPSCASAVGGTLQVVDPPGALVTYFSTSNIPDPGSTSFQPVRDPRPVAVVWNIPVGAQLTLAVTHPTCTLVPWPAAVGAQVLNGQVTTLATEPGDVNGAIILMLQ